MFDLITGNAERPLRERAPRSKVVSASVHLLAGMTLAAIPLFRRPPVPAPSPGMLAFVATPPPAPPPPPAAVHTRSPTAPRRRRASTPTDAPIAARPEAPTVAVPTSGAKTRGDAGNDDDGGVRGGIDGGVPGGVVGGTLGRLVPVEPVPPAPAPIRTPVRITGQMTAPILLHRVNPTYPALAAEANVTGSVVLDVVVNAAGEVESIQVTRSAHPLLTDAAVQAVRQWRYSPLVVNGRPGAFIVTVTLSFSPTPPL